MIEATTIEQSQPHQLTHLDVLRRAAEILLSTDDPAAAAHAIFELAAVPLRLDVFLNFVSDGSGRMLVLHSHAGIADSQARRLQRLEVGEAACGLVALTRRRLMLPDIDESDHPAASSVRDLGMRSYAGFPLLCRGRLLGTMSFGATSRAGFEAEELALLATLCNFLAIAGERMELARTAEQRTHELERVLAEKERLLEQTELLLKEVNHRVKNSLQMVVSLLELQRAAVAEAAAGRPLLEAGARVMALAQVHARLYEGGDVRNVDMDVYLRDLCGELQRSAGNAARVVAQVEAIRLETDRAIPVALIATELVMNAFRHGFPDRAGSATVALARQGGEAVLTVADDGRGLPPDFDPKRSKGLGMRIVNSLTRQLGGRLEVDGPPPGSRFRVRFPLG